MRFLMTVQPKSQEELAPLTISENQVLLAVATAVTQLLSPPLTALAALIVAALLAPAQVAWNMVAVPFFWSIFLPTGYVIVQYIRGGISDLHMNKREERFWPMIFSVLGAAVGWLILFIQDAPLTLLVVMTTHVLLSIAMLVITSWWKISMHSASIGTLAVFVMLFTGRAALPALLLVPLVGWARVYLRRHTTAQTIAGAFLGGAIVWLAFLLLGAA
jgi:membrane-associated phospholipid phosphatase